MKKRGKAVIKLFISAILITVLAFFLSGCGPSGCGSEKPEEVDRDDTSDTVRDGGIASAYADYFKVGVGAKKSIFANYGNLMYHFNSTSPESDMKWNKTEPEEGEFTYSTMEGYMDSAAEYNLGVRGHTLIWYQSTPKWVHDKLGNGCKMGNDGNPITEVKDGKELRISDTQPNRELGLQVMNHRIETAMEQLGDRVYVWDVVNEALLPQSDAEEPLTSKKIEAGDIYRDGINDARHFGKSQTDPGSGETVYWRLDWKTIIGDDFVSQAFDMADKVATENGYDVDLYYNDYELKNPVKREAAVRLIKDLQEKGVRIDGIGEQGHYSLDDYLNDKEGWINNFEVMIQKFTELGVDVQITELEVRVNNVENGKLSEQQEKDQAEMYGEIFRICRKYSNKYAPWKEGAGRVTGITMWGIADYEGEYCFLFNNDGTPKMAVDAIMSFAEDDIAEKPDTQNVKKIDDVADAETEAWNYAVEGSDADYEIYENNASANGDSITLRAGYLGKDLSLVYLPDYKAGSEYTVEFNIQTNKSCGGTVGSQLIQLTGTGENGLDSQWLTVRSDRENAFTFSVSYSDISSVVPVRFILKPTSNFEVKITDFVITEKPNDSALHNVKRIEDQNAPEQSGKWYYWLADTDESKYELAENSFNDGTLTVDLTSISAEMRFVYLPAIETGKSYKISFTITASKECGTTDGVNKYLQFINYGTGGSTNEWVSISAGVPTQMSYDLSYKSGSSVKPLKFSIRKVSNFRLTISDFAITENLPDTNSWVKTPEVSVEDGVVTPSYEALYGNDTVIVEYKSKDADDSAYSVTKPSLAGEYTARFTVESTVDYTGLTYTVDFTVTESASSEESYDLEKSSSDKNPPSTNKWYYYNANETTCVVSEAKFENGTLSIKLTKSTSKVTFLILSDISGPFTFSADITSNRTSKVAQFKNGASSEFVWIEAVENEPQHFEHTTSTDSLIRFELNANSSVSEENPLIMTISNISMIPVNA